MIGMVRTVSSFSVSDIDSAGRFYGDAVGLPVTRDERGVLWLRIGGEGSDNSVLVYPKADHAPAAFTVLNFFVNDIEQAVDDLDAHGVRIQRFEGFATDEKGIHHTRDRSIAWFSDPAGNILSVAQEH